MNLGLGLMLGSRSAQSVLDPSTISLSGWWRASYSASPWSGLASAGASSGRNLTEATHPPTVGTAINALTPAQFNGTSTRLGLAVGWTTLCGNAAGTAIVLFYADAAGTNGGSGFNDPCLLADSPGSGTIALSFSTAGVRAYLNSTGAKTVTIACGTGAYHMAAMRWDASNLYLSLDGGAKQSIALGTTNILSSLQVGQNYSGTLFYQGNIAEIMLAPSTLADATISQIRQYFNARYGLSL